MGPEPSDALGRSRRWTTSRSTGYGSPTSDEATGRHWSCSTAPSATAGCGGRNWKPSPPTTRWWPGTRPDAASRPTHPRATAWPTYARCLAGLIEALDLGPTHLLGHSWGTALALELAHRRPELVNTLVLVGAYAGWAGSLPPDEVERRLDFAHQLADSIPSSFDPRSMPGLFSDVMPPDRAAELAGIMSDIRPAGTRMMAEALAASDQREILGSIDAPALLVYGDQDIRSPVEIGEELHEALSNSTLTVLPGLGHECYLEDAARFEEAVRTFLDAHRRRER
ncbi:MAG: alpha/beta hydrolase [Acidimicrobiales bacterium]|nr:alpha/beta hydrolase [Acidimicrobiales bacterium]